MNNESKVCVAEMADAYMLACGKLIDRDTNIQTLPGSFKNAKEMVQLRKKGLSKEEIEAKARRLIEYQFRLVFKDGYEVSPITVGYREKRQANQARKKTERRARAEAELDSLRTVKAA
jgi:beta-glucosidase-like glycosyl hydrolase